MENDNKQKNNRYPAIIFIFLALWVIFRWILEFGMMHQPSWIELAVFVSLVWMLKWMQFNQDTPNCPKMAVFFIGFCLLLLLGVYFFPMQIENLIWQYPVN